MENNVTDKKVNIPEFSVSELSLALKRMVEDTFSYVRVRGEISGLMRAASGHVYLSLKDENAVLEAVCWKGVAAKLPFVPEDGLEVVCEGKLSTYPQRSKYQLVISRMEPAGEGALMALLEERKKKLAAEGLFSPERKKSLPYIPSTIGVITSPTGAVIQDILHRLNDRFPRHVIVWPVQVQGKEAAGQIARAIAGFNALKPGERITRPDLLIVARGGGSLEDLWAFNEEIVVRAAAASEIPLISAVGHETDTTLIDFASDHRAPTPTAAAEAAVPVRSDLQFKTADLTQRLEAARRRFFKGLHDKLAGLERGLPSPRDILGLATQRLDDLNIRLPRGLASFLQGQALKLQRIAGGLTVLTIRQSVHLKMSRFEDYSRRLEMAFVTTSQARVSKLSSLGRVFESLGYHSILKRGFAVIRDSGGKAVTFAKNIGPGAALDIEFKDGHVPVVASGSEPPAKNKALGHRKAKPSKKDQGSLF